MINGDNTTFDWQKHIGEICVWSIGAFEQHSTHLPLNTGKNNDISWIGMVLVSNNFRRMLFRNMPS